MEATDSCCDCNNNYNYNYKEEKEAREKRKIAKENRFIQSEIGKRWLLKLYILQYEKDLIIKNDLSYSDFVNSQNELDKHISLRESLENVVEKQYYINIEKEENSHLEPKIVNTFTPNEESPFLQDFFNKINLEQTLPF